jgi:hypothetical protein
VLFVFVITQIYLCPFNRAADCHVAYTKELSMSFCGSFLLAFLSPGNSDGKPCGTGKRLHLFSSSLRNFVARSGAFRISTVCGKIDCNRIKLFAQLFFNIVNFRIESFFNTINLLIQPLNKF